MNIIWYGYWNIRCDRQNFLSFWVIFCPFRPLTCPKNYNLKKMKKTTTDIITVHKCTKNHDHMLYCYWDMARDGCNYFSFQAIFCPFTPLIAQKIKFFKKWKKNTWRYHHFTQVYHKWQSYDVWLLRSQAWLTECFVILDHFLPFHPPNPKN